MKTITSYLSDRSGRNGRAGGYAAAGRERASFDIQEEDIEKFKAHVMYHVWMISGNVAKEEWSWAQLNLLPFDEPPERRPSLNPPSPRSRRCLPSRSIIKRLS